MNFIDRRDAGQQLVKQLEKYHAQPNTLVIGLPRGGVVVAFEVAKALKLPLEVLIVRKIGAPYNPELALGAIAETGVGFFNQDIISLLGITKDYLEKSVQHAQQLAAQRAENYKQYYHKQNLAGKTVILVDDGLATGASMNASILAMKALQVAHISVAVPIASRETLSYVKSCVDEAIALRVPFDFHAVGQAYDDFSQTSDAEVIALLQEASNNK